MVDLQKFAHAQYLTVAEVASAMRVSKMTVYRLVQSGDLPAVRFGRSYRVPIAAVEEYLARSSTRRSSPTTRHPADEGHPRVRAGRSGSSTAAVHGSL